MKLLTQLFALVSLGCAEIEISVKETTNGLNVICNPRAGLIFNTFRRWRVCLPDNDCVECKHRIAGGRRNMSEVIILDLQQVHLSDETFSATVVAGNIFSVNTSAVNLSLSCAVTQSGGLVWSDQRQISLQITSEPPTQNKTVPSKPGPTHPNNTSRPSDNYAVTAVPAKYVMFVCIVMTVVLMGVI